MSTNKNMVSTNKNVEKELLVGLDLGTSKVSAVVCEISSQDEMEIIGVIDHPSQGMQRGMIANIDQTVESISKAIHEVELLSACEISGVFAGITGSHIRSYNSTGVVAIRGSEVTADDISRVIEAAQAVRISSDEKILHVLPQAFTIDDQDGIRDPLGLSGVRLEAKVNVVICNVSAVKNILRCIEYCDLEVENIILDPIASSHAVLSEDERDLGVGLLDIGEGTTDLSVYYEGEVHHSVSIPMAGYQVTRDIAITLQTATSEAKQIKHNLGSAVPNNIAEDQTIELRTIGRNERREVPRKYLSIVIEARLKEIFEHVQQNLIETNYKKYLRSGLVLTGGTSRVKDIEVLAEQIFDLPIRLAAPQYDGPLQEVVCHPMFSTAVGLCKFGYMIRERFPEIRNLDDASAENVVTKALHKLRNLYTGGAEEYEVRETGRMRGWFQGEY